MGKKRKKAGELVPAPASPDTTQLLSDLRTLIDAGRTRVAQAVNAGLVVLYWGVGERIRREILPEQRATYGQQILQTLSEELTAEYGRGFGLTNLSPMVRFAETFPDRDIIAALSQQLGWSHFIEIIPLDDPYSANPTSGCAGWGRVCHAGAGRWQTRPPSGSRWLLRRYADTRAEFATSPRLGATDLREVLAAAGGRPRPRA